MNSPTFEHLARLYVVGALDEDELQEFERLRSEGGEGAEQFIAECERLSEAFALSLRPTAPDMTTKKKLLDRIRSGGKSMTPDRQHVS